MNISMSKEHRAHWGDIANYQLQVLDLWVKLAIEKPPLAFQFVAYFSALNAIYWLWDSIDTAQRALNGDAPLKRSELRQIQFLIDQLQRDAVEQLLNNPEISATVEYFVSTRLAIRNMKERQKSQDGKSTKWKEELAASIEPHPRLKALASILYQVRCNLVHGSKYVTGPDDQLLERCIPALRELARAARDYTETQAAGLWFYT